MKYKNLVSGIALVLASVSAQADIQLRANEQGKTFLFYNEDHHIKIRQCVDFSPWITTRSECVSDAKEDSYSEEEFKKLLYSATYLISLDYASPFTLEKLQIYQFKRSSVTDADLVQDIEKHKVEIKGITNYLTDDSTNKNLQGKNDNLKSELTALSLEFKQRAEQKSTTDEIQSKINEMIETEINPDGTQVGNISNLSYVTNSGQLFFQELKSLLILDNFAGHWEGEGPRCGGFNFDVTQKADGTFKIHQHGLWPENVFLMQIKDHALNYVYSAEHTNSIKINPANQDQVLYWDTSEDAHFTEDVAETKNNYCTFRRQN